MHPDQATESIVDFALHFNKPFAVIPCCVFPRLFPNRFVVKRTVVSSQDPSSSLAPPPPPATPPLHTQLKFSEPSTPSFLVSPSSSQLSTTLASESVRVSEKLQETSSQPHLEQVVVHEQLVRYLADKGEAEVIFLPFEGSNQVVFRTIGILDNEQTCIDQDPKWSACCSLPDSGFGAGILSWIGL